MKSIIAVMVVVFGLAFYASQYGYGARALHDREVASLAKKSQGYSYFRGYNLRGGGVRYGK
jgi:hypothetical protein